ncbi:MAG: aspartate aminotransferase family protein [Deltaproteobacteria bacterium]|nr:aspartate aminotransferase family protein [Deltaproteobacteria bacterium]
MQKDIEHSHFLHYNLRVAAPMVERGKGIYLYDTSGKKYIDGTSGPVVCNIGHGVKEIGEAYAAQAEKVAYVFRSHFTSEPSENLATLIAEMAPEGLEGVFFVSSGSEGTEMTAKIAHQYYLEKNQVRKELVVSRWLSYHGITMGALSMSGHIQRRQNFVNSLLPYPKIPIPNCYRCPENSTYPACNIACAYRLKETIQMVGAEYISAFIAEPVVGASAGAVVPPPEYYKIIREICDEFDILFIADEVMCGFGRTGFNFAIENWNVTPDMIVFAKGASAGYYPLAGVIISDKIFRVLKDGKKGIFAPGHTYSGTPMAGAVGVKVIEYMLKHRLIENVNTLSGYLLDRLKTLYAHKIVGEIRGLGFLLGIEFVKDQKTKEPFHSKQGGEIAALIAKKAFEKGLILYPGGGCMDGIRGDHILIAPPFIIEKSEIDEIVSILDRSISEVESEVL